MLSTSSRHMKGTTGGGRRTHQKQSAQDRRGYQPKRRQQRRAHSQRHIICQADLSQALYSATQALDDVLIGSFKANSVQWYIYPLTTVAGLATSLSPCVLSILPITVGYIGGYAETSEGEQGEGKGQQLSSNAAGFAVGLASSFAVLGVFSTAIGKTYGQTGPALPCVVSIIAITMGLNLLEVIQLQFPSAFQNFDARTLNIPPFWKSYLAGLAFAFVSSPCSTPVLATLLAYVATLDNAWFGGLLLLFYALGYVSPLLVAASATEVLKGIPAFRAYSQWINPVSGMLLVAGGTYFFLDNTGALLAQI